MAQSFQQAQHGPAFSAGAGATMNGVQGELDRLKGEIDILGLKIETQQELVRQAMKPGGDRATLTFETSALDSLVAEKKTLIEQRGAVQAQLAPGSQGQGQTAQGTALKELVTDTVLKVLAAGAPDRKREREELVELVCLGLLCKKKRGGKLSSCVAELHDLCI